MTNPNSRPHRWLILAEENIALAATRPYISPLASRSQLESKSPRQRAASHPRESCFRAGKKLAPPPARAPRAASLTSVQRDCTSPSERPAFLSSVAEHPAS